MTVQMQKKRLPLHVQQQRQRLPLHKHRIHRMHKPLQKPLLTK